MGEPRLRRESKRPYGRRTADSVGEPPAFPPANCRRQDDPGTKLRSYNQSTRKASVLPRRPALSAREARGGSPRRSVAVPRAKARRLLVAKRGDWIEPRRAHGG